MAPTDGTSFAAPLVAGVAGQVITILKSRGVLPAKPREKLALVKAILKASADWSKASGNRHPVVNSLLATLIASEIGAKPGFNTDELILLGRNSEANRKACSAPAENCSQVQDCGKKKICVNDLRYRLTACVPAPEGSPPQKDMHDNLFTSLQQLEERELTLQLIDRLPKKSKLAKEVRQELERQWKEALETDLPGVKLGSEGRALNLLYSAQRAGFSKGLKPVRDDMEKKTAKYFVTLKQQIKRLYGLDE